MGRVTLVGTVTMLPIMTPTVPVRFVPLIVTDVPTGPVLTLSDVMLGGGVT